MKLLPILLGFIPLSSLAIPAPELDENVAIPKLHHSTLNIENNNVSTNEKFTNELSSANNPESLRILINQIIDNGQWNLLSTLLDIYQTTPNPDQVLIDYGKGILLQQKGEYTKAISLYRGIIASHPNYQPVRFRLAQMLFEDRQNEAALAQFRKLQSDSVPNNIANLIKQYIQAIQQRDEWTINFGINYLHENNVNNASKSKYFQLGNVRFEKNKENLPKSANGLSYFLNIQKTFNLKNSHYIYFENQLSGKNFWDNHQYDDITNRTSLGYQYQDARNRFATLPFYSRRWYGNHRYNKSVGIRLEFDRWLNEHWQLSLASEWEKLTHYAPNYSLNGISGLGSTTLLYAFNAKAYVYGGVDYSLENTLNKELSSRRKTVRVGWGQEWWGGISTRFQYSYGIRKFKQPNYFFDIPRKDNEKNISLTIWHRNIYFYGITPKLTWQYSNVNSNLSDLYSTKRQKVFLSLEKTF